MPKLFNIRRKIIADLRVELLDEFDQNFIRKAFFDRPWPERKHPGGRGSLMQVTGRGRRSIRGLITSNSVAFSSDTPYMGLHNRGGKIKITPRMRKFFWAMYYKNTGSVTYSIKKREANNTAKNRKLSAAALYWRGLALTRKDAITIPQRQFVGDHPRVRKIIREVVNRNLQDAFRELGKALKRQ